MGMGGLEPLPRGAGPHLRHRPAALDLRVLDTTDPAAVAGSSTSSASSTRSSSRRRSRAPRSRPAATWPLLGAHRRRRPSRFVAITDPGTELAELAAERGFRARVREPARHRRPLLGAVVLRPRAGALLGVDVARLLARRRRWPRRSARRCRRRRTPGCGSAPSSARRRWPAGTSSPSSSPEEIATFGLWLEQLVAESTGKHGTGVVPVAGEPLGPPEVYGDDRLFVALGARRTTASTPLADAGHPVVELAYGGPLDLGGQVLLWELATAAVRRGARHQPVRPAQRGRGQGGHRPRCWPTGLPDDRHRAARRRCSTRCGPATTSPSRPSSTPATRRARRASRRPARALRDRLRVATTVGIGPRFLHSTGQLHKGGPPTGVFVQVVGRRRRSTCAIPGAALRFSTLKQAQAAGDLLTLQRPRPAGRPGARSTTCCVEATR